MNLEIKSATIEPITTFALSANCLPSNLSDHFERLQSAVHFLNGTLPWENFDNFLNDIQTQQALLSEETRHQALRIRLQPFSNSQKYAAHFEFRPIQEAASSPQKLKLVPYERPLAHYKYSDYSTEDALLKQAKDEGFDDILRTTHDGLISEGRVSNVFIQLSSGEWVTPAAQESCCLAGTTRKLLLAKHPEIKQILCPTEWLFTGQVIQVFLCNALHPYMPVSQVHSDDQSVTLPPSKEELVTLSL